MISSWLCWNCYIRWGFFLPFPNHWASNQKPNQNRVNCKQCWKIHLYYLTVNKVERPTYTINWWNILLTQITVTTGSMKWKQNCVFWKVKNDFSMFNLLLIYLPEIASMLWLANHVLVTQVQKKVSVRSHSGQKKQLVFQIHIKKNIFLNVLNMVW